MAEDISEKTEHGGHDSIAEVYDNQKKGWYMNRLKVVPRKVSELTGKERPSVLEMGCGTGLVLSWFEGKKTGVDCSAGMIEVAKRQRPDAKYAVSDVRSFRTREKFDAVVMVDLIEFIEDLSFLSGARGMLADGGVLFIANASPKLRPAVWLLDKMKRKLPTGKWLWRKPQEITAAMEAAGFRNVCSESRFPHVYYWGFE